MATTTKNGAKATAKNQSVSVRTGYIVLRAIELDDAARKALGLANTAQRVLWAPVLNEKAEHGPDGHPRVFTAAAKSKAIETYAGKPGTPDAKVGTFKAVALTSWQGGEVYEAPPKPLVQRKPLEDAV